MPILTKSQIHLSNRRCFKYRKKILDLSQRVGALHIGGSFSSVEILDVIYNLLLKKMISSYYQRVTQEYFNM